MSGKSNPELIVCVLAGGLSSRLGQDKTRLRLGGRTLVGHARAAAGALGLPVRVIRRDRVPRCGPLGGVYTAFLSSRAGAVLFLAADMPFVRTALLERVVADFRRHGRAVFVLSAGGPGFPFLLPRGCLERVKAQIQAGAFSLRELAAVLQARLVPVGRAPEQLFNINTAKEWEMAQQRWAVAKERQSVRGTGSRRPGS